MKKLLLVACLLLPVGGVFAGSTTVDFEDLTLSSESYWNGSDLSGGLTSNGAWFSNNYNSTWGSWDGFSCSNIHDVTNGSYENQYAAYSNLSAPTTGGGCGGGGNYAVVYVSAWSGLPTVNLSHTTTVSGGMFTNTTYAALSMLNGDAFAKKFGGDTGDDPDWFALTITGYDALNGAGNSTGSLTFYLADYRGDDDWVLEDWTWFDLEALGEVRSLSFSLSSSDTGDSGINTPTYFAMDNLVYSVPEPTALIILVTGGVAMLKRRRSH